MNTSYNLDTSGSNRMPDWKEKIVLERTHCTHCGKVLSTKYDDGTVIPERFDKPYYCECDGAERARMMENLNREDRRDFERNRGRWQK